MTVIEHFQPGFFWPVIGVFFVARASHAAWPFFSRFLT